MNWLEEYRKKLITAEEAVAKIKDGDYVVFPGGRQAKAIGEALTYLRNRVRGVRVFLMTSDRTFQWYEPSWEDTFEIVVGFPLPPVVSLLSERRADLGITPIAWTQERMERGFAAIDVLVVEVSPPDANGYCSLGQSVFEKKEQIASAKLVLAEVNDRLIRTYGENYVHVSEIDYFVPHPPSTSKPGTKDLRGSDRADYRRICRYAHPRGGRGATGLCCWGASFPGREVNFCAPLYGKRGYGIENCACL